MHSKSIEEIVKAAAKREEQRPTSIVNIFKTQHCGQEIADRGIDQKLAPRGPFLTSP
jgi:hypothetical protein